MIHVYIIHNDVQGISQEKVRCPIAVSLIIEYSLFLISIFQKLKFQSVLQCFQITIVHTFLYLMCGSTSMFWNKYSWFINK